MIDVIFIDYVIEFSLIVSELAWTENPGIGTAFAISSIAGTIVIWFLIYGLYRLREYLQRETWLGRTREYHIDIEKEKKMMINDNVIQTVSVNVLHSLTQDASKATIL